MAAFGFKSGMASNQPLARREAETIEFSPYALGSDLLVWYDAENPESLTMSGSLVSEWRERRGGIITLTQAVSSTKPIYNATGLNGRPSVRFDGTDDRLNSPQTQAQILTALLTGTAATEIWARLIRKAERCFRSARLKSFRPRR